MRAVRCDRAAAQNSYNNRYTDSDSLQEYAPKSHRGGSIVGRQARLKKIRQEASEQPPVPESSEPTQFVKQLERQGYNLKQIQRSPELPNDNPEPEL